MVLSLLACTGTGTAESAAPVGPAVESVSPEDGAVDAVEAVTPQLRFSAGVDLASCAADALRLDGVNADHTVAFPVPIEVSADGEGTRIALDPAAILPRGWSYALTVRGGGCEGLQGGTIEPFYSAFAVP